MNTVTLHVGDVRDVMASLPDRGHDLLVTSPPFLALRSYLPADHPDKHREIGSEPTPATFLDTLYGLTADWGRLLPEWASICVELGDTMSGSGGENHLWDTYTGNGQGGTRYPQNEKHPPGGGKRDRSSGWPLAKSMCLIPHLYTIGLAYGMNPLTGTTTPAGQWRIRNVVTWARPNPPVGSLGKRNPQKRTGDYKFRPACSYITVACRGTGRYFDLDAVRLENPRVDERPYVTAKHEAGTDIMSKPFSNRPAGSQLIQNPAGAPPLDWHTDQLDGDWLWKLATAPYKGAHYATMPLTLPRRLILAMCPAEMCRVCGWPRERVVQATDWPKLGTVPLVNDGGIGTHGDRCASITTLGFTDCGHDQYRPGHVIDPFAGSGTTAVAAALEGRDCTLIDLDPRNVDLTERRLAEVCRILDRTVDGDTTRWLVEPESAKVLTAVASGQLELFGGVDE